MKPGAFNLLIPCVGVPNSGKTWYAYHRAKLVAKKTPAYFIVHDAGWALPDDPAILRYASTGEAANGLARHPKRVHALSVADGDEVVNFALRCAEASRAMGGPPILLMIDEGVASEGMSAYRLSVAMKNLIARRRWLNVGLIVTAQSPMLIHYQLFALATEIVMFRTIDEQGLKRLERFGVPHDTLNRLRTLPNRECIIHTTS